MRLFASRPVRAVTGWHARAVKALISQGVHLEVDDSLAEDGDDARRSARDLANGALSAGAHGVMALDWRVVRALCGNPTYRGRLVTLLNEETLADYRSLQSSAYSAAIFDACAIIVAPSKVATELIEAQKILPGQAFVVDGPEDPAGLLFGASPAIASLNPEERLKFALAQSRIAVGLVDSDDLDEGQTSRLAFSSDTGRDSTAILRIDPRGSQESPGRASWRLRHLHECCGLRLVLTDDLPTAAYSSRHPNLASVVVPIIGLDSGRTADLSSGEMADLERSSRWLAVRSENERNDLELVRPAIAGRVLVIPPISGNGTPLARLAERIGPPAPRRRGTAAHRLLLAGHDLKFSGAIIEELTRRHDVSIDVHSWDTQYRAPEHLAQNQLESADTVWVEFAAGPAAWYARRKRPHQRLIVRVHGYEVRGPWGDEIDWNAVDVLVCVSSHVRDAALARWPVHPTKAIVLSNAVDTHQLHRPKLPDAAFTLGLLGWTPALKRLDRAVALVDRLRRVDNRFRLVVKGSPVTQEGWYWTDQVQRRAYEAVFHRLRKDSELASHISFEEHDGAVARWFTNVGWILSPSDSESFHLAGVEGMASGAVPIVWNREGATTIFPKQFIIESTDDARLFVENAAETWSDLSHIAVEASHRYDALHFRSTLWQVIGLTPSH